MLALFISLGVVGWVICGAVNVRLNYDWFRREGPMLAWDGEETAFSIVMFLTGPIGLISTLAAFPPRFRKREDAQGLGFNLAAPLPSPSLPLDLPRTKASAPIVAWRAWNIVRDNGQWALKSISNQTIWPAGELLEAKDFDRTSYGAGASGGIHAVNDWATAHRQGSVAGQVYLAGDVVEQEQGYRAEYAYPKSLKATPCRCGTQKNALMTDDEIIGIACLACEGDKQVTFTIRLKHCGLPLQTIPFNLIVAALRERYGLEESSGHREAETHRDDRPQDNPTAAA